MIKDRIENLRIYKNLNPLFIKAFDYVHKTDFTKLEPGKYNVDGENVFALLMEYDTKSENDCLLESHLKYIDIQYLLAGEEYIGIASLVNQKPYIPYDAEKDVAFYPDEAFQIKLEAGSFMIFFPTDLHRPCIKVNDSVKVKKLVIKIMA